jgi:hypothetical protein
MKTYTQDAWDKLWLKGYVSGGNSSFKLKGHSEVQKIMELFYLDQLGHRVDIHYDTDKVHCQSIEKYMDIKTVLV